MIKRQGRTPVETGSHYIISGLHVESHIPHGEKGIQNIAKQKAKAEMGLRRMIVNQMDKGLKIIALPDGFFHFFGERKDVGHDVPILAGMNVIDGLTPDPVLVLYEPIQPAAAFYHIPPSNIIVIQDDIALPPGKLRIKRGGSDGGHNGIKSITQRLGTQDYPRIKIGVGSPPHPDYDVIDWVIGKLSDAEYKEIKDAASRAVSAAEEIVSHGIDSAMNKFNH